ncbi:MAG: dATP/dGTP diphosphohydrolase domain-containing protein [Bacteroidales bacterium]
MKFKIGDKVMLSDKGVRDFSVDNWADYSIPYAMYKGDTGVIESHWYGNRSDEEEYYVTNSVGRVFYGAEQLKLVDESPSYSSLESRKNDKNQMELVDTGFPNALMMLGEVMTWAAKNKGYLPNDWKDIPNPSMSLLGAASRHRNKRLKGEEFDDESGLPHLAHEAFNVLAQLELLMVGKLND